MGALFGRGSVLKLAGSTINQITKIDGPKVAGKPVTVTNHGSAGISEEYLGTTIDVTWSVTLNFDPADTTHVALRTAACAQSTVAFTYTKAGEVGTPGTFNGIVKGWNESEDPAKQRVATFDLVVTGTFTAAHV